MLAVSEKRLGEILVESGVISPLEMEEAFQRQRITGEMLGRVLVKMGLCEEQDIVEALGVQSGMERVDVLKLQIPDEVLHKVPADVAQFYNVVPVRFRDNVLTVAMADPLNISQLDDLKRILGCEVQGAVGNQHDIAKFIAQHYSHETESIHETLSALIERVGMPL